MRGEHLIRHWTGTQATQALSSAEAELVSLVRGASEGIGAQSLLNDFGVSANIVMATDASAAIGICKRSGVGEIRHLDTRLLWIQDKVRGGDIEERKVPGCENPADLLTKHLGAEAVSKDMSAMQCWPRAGRASTAPRLTVQ